MAIESLCQSAPSFEGLRLSPFAALNGGDSTEVAERGLDAGLDGLAPQTRVDLERPEGDSG
jgi:hypothetical protein